MADYATLLRERVVLTCRSVDRIFLQAYVPKLQSVGLVCRFLRWQRHFFLPSSAAFGKIGDDYVAQVHKFGAEHDIHPDLRADIELKVAQAANRQTGELVAAGRVTGASLRCELENARAQNHRLTKQLRALERRLSQTEGAHLVADELFPNGALAELADRQLAERVAELDQQLFEAKEELRRVKEDVEAARAINRELMQQANRPPAEDLSRSRRPTSTRKDT